MFDDRAALLTRLVSVFRPLLRRSGSRLRRAEPPVSQIVEAILSLPCAQGLSEQELLRVYGAFDPAFYLNTNPDVRAAQVEPFFHFMEWGWRERRDPSPAFSTAYYLARNLDIARAGINPFVHWVLHGQREARRGSAYASALEDPPSLAEELRNVEDADVQRLMAAFDSDFYLRNNPNVAACGVDPFTHYITIGWRAGRDPSERFSTEYYLRRHPDITEAEINPFVHWVLYGRDERRAAIPYFKLAASGGYRPKISAIVPNYNHAPFLRERIDSILSQSYKNVDILVLDDCSSDNSREVIADYVSRFPGRIRSILNETNSGGVFRQWRKGIDNTDGELVWICESDDFCEPDFLEKLVPYFADGSLSIAFGRILQTDRDGNVNYGLDHYREGAEPGIWDKPLARPAQQWFANGFGVNNLIANVGGCIWRRVSLPDQVWAEAQSYSVVGDWYLYSHLAGGGQIAWEPSAVSYFRQHGANTSVTSFKRPVFYQELERLMLTLRRQWDVPDATVEKFHSKVVEHYEWLSLEDELGPLEQYCDKARLLAQGRSRPHLLVCLHGFIPGGGEVFPINLANQLHDAGWLVSLLAIVMDEVNASMRASLNPAIAVYDAMLVDEYGAERFIADAGISLIHSHSIGAEYNFVERWKIKPPAPYLVTLHGSYEASDLSEEVLGRLAASVDHFVYTADKNLDALKELRLAPRNVTKLPNAMPIDARPFPQTRAELGIVPGAIVFTLVARGIRRKGWRASIDAFISLRERRPDQPMHLLLCGDGEIPDQHALEHGDDPDITFLGYQACIHGLYRLSDVAIVPTRFSGESFPLCIIQALQCGTPVVASRVGEIESMITPDGRDPGGILIEPVRDTQVFVQSLSAAMEVMLDDQSRGEYARAARELGTTYDMAQLARTYGALYKRLIEDAGGPAVTSSSASTFATRYEAIAAGS